VSDKQRPEQLLLASLTGTNLTIYFLYFGVIWKSFFPSICVSSKRQLVKRTAKHKRTQLLFPEIMVM